MPHLSMFMSHHQSHATAHESMEYQLDNNGLDVLPGGDNGPGGVTRPPPPFKSCTIAFVARSTKNKKSAQGTHLQMEIYVGIRRTQSVKICRNGTHFCSYEKMRYYPSRAGV